VNPLSPGQTWRLIAGLAFLFALFHVTAAWLDSTRGQWGLPIALVVVAATLVVERWLLAGAPPVAARGLGVPAPRGILAALFASALLLAIVPITSRTIGWRFAVDLAGGTSLVGLFAQAGIAEETLFRAYLFGHLRAGRTFRQAAMLSVWPFAAVHLVLFWTLPWPIAVASIVLAIVVSFPLAWLFELGGRTIWAPALVHAVVQGAVKVFTVSDSDTPAFPLIWMAAAAVLPFVVFAVRPARPGEAMTNALRR
jgi:membrane protease YdiL (CAAX protease family)